MTRESTNNCTTFYVIEHSNYLLLEDTTQIPVSRQKKDITKEQLEHLK